MLDEPTSSLTQEEIREFYSVVNRLKTRASFIFISHRLSEILEVSDRIYVMKDGEIVDMVYPKKVDEKKLHELMVGRKRDEDYYQEHEQLEEFKETVLNVENLSLKGSFEGINLQVRQGEILGIGGVIGSGKSELGKALAGVLQVTTGRIVLNGMDVTGHGIAELIRKGIAYIPEERTKEAIIGGLSINWNISLASLNDIIGNTVGYLKLNKERETAQKFIKKLKIKAQSDRAECSTLSGGNQQKVVLAKWLMRDLKLLIVDNPTRGIDPGTKEEIYKLFRQLTKEGLAIIIISDELLELIGLSNHILVMKDGYLKKDVKASIGNKPSEKQLVSYMV